ncbi:hypothetical protein ACLB2K_040958 [Fragaria x ananassa]
MVNELEKVRLDISCGVCMDEFEKGVTVIRLPCLHIFHGTCIFRWMEKNHDNSYEPDVTFSSDTVYRHSYYAAIESKTCTPAPTSMLQIRFSLYKSNQVGSLLRDGEVLRTSMPDAEQIHLKTEPILLEIPSGFELQPAMITQVLRSMSVPPHEQAPIVAKILETVASINAVAAAAGAFINADIHDETGIGCKGSRRGGIISKFSSLGLQLNQPLRGLERVRFDTSCGICKDDFEDGLIATRFPCLHIFHGDCILCWLIKPNLFCFP